MTIPKLPKVQRVDRVPGLFDGDVVVMEKVDGSQFRIKLTPDGWDCGSKSVNGKDNIDKSMFDIAIKEAERIWNIYTSTEWVDKYGAMYLYCEYLRHMKHNTLEYSRVPENHLYLFNVMVDCPGGFKPLDPRYTGTLRDIARVFEIDPPNILHTGKASVDLLDRLLETESYLGGCKVEGVVVYNYSRTYTNIPQWIGFPLMGKYVRPEFTELNNENWSKIKKPVVERVIEKYITPQRFEKVIAHLKEQGLIEGHMRDMKYIYDEFFADLYNEEECTLMFEIYNAVMSQVEHRAKKILTKWYTDRLKGVE